MHAFVAKHGSAKSKAEKKKAETDLIHSALLITAAVFGRMSPQDKTMFIKTALEADGDSVIVSEISEHTKH